MTETLKRTPAFQPTDPEFLRDPYPCYRALREAGPLLKEGATQWVASGHAVVQELMRHEGVRSDWPEPFQALRMGDGAAKDFLLRVLLHREGPSHTALRQILSGTMRRVPTAVTQRRIAELTDAVLDEALDAGELELVARIVVPVPVAVSCDMLGIPSADEPLISRWGMSTIKAFTTILPEAERAEVDDAIAQLRQYLDEAWRSPEGHPLGTALAEFERVAAGGFDRTEIIDNVVFLLVSGFTTTVHLLANMFGALLNHPDQWRLLQADPALVNAAVEEVIRWDAPIQYVSRHAATRVEVAGETIRPGRVIHLLIGSANRDEAVFADPDRFDVTRTPNPHVGFGAGRHMCLGAGLGRVEARTVLERMVARCATFAPAGELVRRPMQVFRTYDRLPAAVLSR